MDNEKKNIISPFDINDKKLLDAIKEMTISENKNAEYMGLTIYLSRLEYNKLPFLFRIDNIKVVKNDSVNSKFVIKIDNKIIKILNQFDIKCQELLKNNIIVNNDDNDEDPFCISYMDSYEDGKLFDIMYNFKTNIFCNDVEMAPADVQVGDKISVILMIDSIIFIVNTREAKTKYNVVLIDLHTKKPRESTKKNMIEEFIYELIKNKITNDEQYIKENEENEENKENEENENIQDNEKVITESVELNDVINNSSLKSKKNTKLKKSVKQAEPVEKVKTTKGKKSVKQAEPVEKVKTTKGKKSVKQVEQIEQVKKTKGKKSVKQVEPVEPVEQVETVEPVEPVEPVKKTKGKKSVKQVEQV